MGFVNRVAPFVAPVGFILPMTFNDNGKDGAKTGTRGSRPPRSEGLPVQSFRVATASAGGGLAPSAGAADLEDDVPSPTKRGPLADVDSLRKSGPVPRRAQYGRGRGYILPNRNRLLTSRIEHPYSIRQNRDG